MHVWGVLFLGLVLGCGLEARAQSITGQDWVVHFNLPDQNYFDQPYKYVIREALLARIDSLQSNDVGYLATYTFSGNTADYGAAGPILSAISNALDRGAQIGFVADKVVDITSNFWPGVSLSSLAARVSNPLRLSRDDSPSWGIMHDKLGVFRVGSTSWVFIASWNFTGGASSMQWNLALELRNAALFGAYTNEMREMLEGRFHDHPEKSHIHDGTPFTLPGSWRAGWVRFAPYSTSSTNGPNAQADILQLIGDARHEIYFALNRVNRPMIRDALVAAADRGVMIYGVIPKSDRTTTNDTSYEVYAYLNEATNYAGTNVVHFLDAYAKADYSAIDEGQSDLVHAKYMTIDPWFSRPVVIHGSANWTDAALASTSANDENVVFVFHRDLARAFFAQFKRMTGAWLDRSDTWVDLARTGTMCRVRGWSADTNSFQLERSTSFFDGWEPVGDPVIRPYEPLAILTNAVERVLYFRVKRVYEP